MPTYNSRLFYFNVLEVEQLPTILIVRINVSSLAHRLLIAYTSLKIVPIIFNYLTKKRLVKT